MTRRTQHGRRQTIVARLRSSLAAALNAAQLGPGPEMESEMRRRIGSWHNHRAL